MSLFVCSRCRHVDNSAAAPGYWQAITNGMPPQCTLCTTGEWHGRFPRRLYSRRVDGPLGAGRRIMSEGRER